MVKENAVDLSIYDVTVVRGIWLGSRVIGVGVYKAPVQNDLIEFTKTQVEEKNPFCYFSLNGDRINPFLLMEDLEIPQEEVVENNVVAVDIESMFKSAREFGSLSDKTQVDYINSIKETPAELTPDYAEEYDRVLYGKLILYKDVAKKKAYAEIEAVLSLYED